MRFPQSIGLTCLRATLVAAAVHLCAQADGNADCSRCSATTGSRSVTGLVPRPVYGDPQVEASLSEQAEQRAIAEENRKRNAEIQAEIQRQKMLAAIRESIGTSSDLNERNAQELAAKDRGFLADQTALYKFARDFDPIAKLSARESGEAAARRVFPDLQPLTAHPVDGRPRITSEDRPSEHKLASPAHDRGSFDLVGPNMHYAARAISKETGSDYIVIHEIPHPASDTNEIFVNTKLHSKRVPKRATAEHIHVQPQWNSRLHHIVSHKDATEAGIRDPKTSGGYEKWW